MPRPKLQLEAVEDRLLPSSMALSIGLDSSPLPFSIEGWRNVLEARLTSIENEANLGSGASLGLGVSAAGVAASTMTEASPNASLINPEAGESDSPLHQLNPGVGVVVVGQTDSSPGPPWSTRFVGPSSNGSYSITDASGQSPPDAFPRAMISHWANSGDNPNPGGYPNGPFGPHWLMWLDQQDANWGNPPPDATDSSSGDQSDSSDDGSSSESSSNTYYESPKIVGDRWLESSGSQQDSESDRRDLIDPRIMWELTLAPIAVASQAAASNLSAMAPVIPTPTVAQDADFPAAAIDHIELYPTVGFAAAACDAATDCPPRPRPAQMPATAAPENAPLPGVAALDVTELDQRVSDVLAAVGSLGAELTEELQQPDVYPWVTAAGLLSAGAVYISAMGRRRQRVIALPVGRGTLRLWEDQG